MQHNNAHIETGIAGEKMALHFIISKKYEVLQCNWRHQKCEVDIIAFKEKTLHFFEVKTRKGIQLTLPETSVTNAKMNKLKQAAQEYLHQYPQWQYLQFNIVAITLFKNKDPEIYLIEDVF